MAEHVTIQEGKLADYLRHRMPEAEGLEIHRLKRNVGGMSRETWFTEIVWREGGKERIKELTVRVDPPGGSVVPTPLLQEFKIHSALQQTDVPVAKPLWYEDDPSWLGAAPFYIREMIEGSSTPKLLWQEGQEELRQNLGRQLAEYVGRVHTADWEKAGFGDFMEVPKDARDCALLELERWKRYFHDYQIEARPVMAELFSWLERNAPTDVARVSLVWGDVGLGNFIFQGDRIVGLTDWEQAHLGDPMKDLAFALWRGVDNLLPRPELLRIYEETSGIKVNEDSIRYYTAFICTESCCTTHPALRFFLDGSNPDVTLARLVLAFPYSCQDLALRITGV